MVVRNKSPGANAEQTDPLKTIQPITAATAPTDEGEFLENRQDRINDAQKFNGNGGCAALGA